MIIPNKEAYGEEIKYKSYYSSFIVPKDKRIGEKHNSIDSGMIYFECFEGCSFTDGRPYLPHGAFEVRTKNIYDVNTYSSLFYNCDFSYSYIDKSAFMRCIFINCNFNDSIICNTSFYMCAFIDCTFSNIDAYNVSFCQITFAGHTILNGGKFNKCRMIDIVCDTDDWEARWFNRQLSLCNSKPFIRFNIPESGSITGWKKAKYRVDPILSNYCLVKLEIPSSAARCSSGHGKCRAESAYVVSIETLEGKPLHSAFSWYNHSFNYFVGEIVKADNYDPNPFNTCSGGIHFFLSKEEAIAYDY